MAEGYGYILKVSNLEVKIQNQILLQILLDHVSFNVEKGTTLAILGSNGAGKTVLLRTLLSRVPHTGTVDWSVGGGCSRHNHFCGNSVDNVGDET
jgi:ABC-type multidrug transport system ATPase subunit